MANTDYGRSYGAVLVLNPTHIVVNGAPTEIERGVGELLPTNPDEFDNTGTTSAPVNYTQYEIRSLTKGQVTYFLQCVLSYPDATASAQTPSPIDVTVAANVATISGQYAANWQMTSGPGAVLSVNTTSSSHSMTTERQEKVDAAPRDNVTGSEFSVDVEWDMDIANPYHHVLRRAGVRGQAMYFPEGPKIGGGLELFPFQTSQATKTPTNTVTTNAITINSFGAEPTYRQVTSADLYAFKVR